MVLAHRMENSRIFSSMRTCGATARRFRSSKTPRQSQSELSAHQMPLRRHLRLQNSLGYATAFQTSRPPRQVDSIRAELPSNGYPQPSGSLPHSAHSNPLRHIWADWVFPLQDPFKHYGFRSRQGCSPARHAPLLVPLSTSAFVRPALFFLFMRVRRWMP